MKLYEIRIANLGIMRLRDTHYFTSQTEAMKVFRESKKEQAVVDLYQVVVATNLKSADWCSLLASDSPGSTTLLTPQDLITDRVLISTYAPQE